MCACMYWNAPEDFYRFITSRKATCCAQTDLNIKARFFNKTHFGHESLEVVTSIPIIFVFDAWLRR